MADKKPLKIEDLGGGQGSIKEFETGDTLPGSVLPSSDGITEGTTNLYFSAARVRAVTLTGISFVTNAVITATDTILTAAGKLQAQITARAMAGNNADITQLTGLTTPLSREQGGIGGAFGFIEGLQLIRASGLSISITAGSAYVPSVGRVVSYAGGSISPITVPAVDTFIHVYLTSAGTITQSLTAPARYYSQAHILSGDNSRRYIGSLLVQTNAAGVYLFRHNLNDNSITYTLASPQVAPFRIIGGVTTVGAFSCRTVTPSTAHTIEAAWQNTGSAAGQFTPSDAGTPIGSGWTIFVVPGALYVARTPIAGDGTITYSASGGAALSCYALGYYFDR